MTSDAVNSNAEAPFVTAFDIVGNDPSGQAYKTVKEEVFDMDLRIKKAMDAGLTADEMKLAQQVRAATLTALSVVEKLGEKSA
ncbi:MAG: hypothetical protein R3Y11_05910 [Pseudomonadota bacterium]